jgi:hypothetical protein
VLFRLKQKPHLVLEVEANDPDLVASAAQPALAMADIPVAAPAKPAAAAIMAAEVDQALEAEGAQALIAEVHVAHPIQLNTHTA